MGIPFPGDHAAVERQRQEVLALDLDALQAALEVLVPFEERVEERFQPLELRGRGLGVAQAEAEDQLGRLDELDVAAEECAEARRAAFPAGCAWPPLKAASGAARQAELIRPSSSMMLMRLSPP